MSLNSLKSDKILRENSIEVDGKELDYTDVAPLPVRIMAIEKQASNVLSFNLTCLRNLVNVLANFYFQTNGMMRIHIQCPNIACDLQVFLSLS